MKKTMLLLLVVLCLAVCVQALAVSALSYGILEEFEAMPNQKLALRSGPGTKYSEIFTVTPSAIENFVIFQREKGGSTMWGMIEFDSNYGRYRVYTGMKRIDTDESLVPIGNKQGVVCSVDRVPAQAYYGPGPLYAPVEMLVPAKTKITVYHEEQGYVMADFVLPSEKNLKAETEEEKELTRAWISVDALRGYERIDWSVPQVEFDGWYDWELEADEVG